MTFVIERFRVGITEQRYNDSMTNRIDYNLMYARLDQWLDALAAAHAERWPDSPNVTTYNAEKLSKYVRIVMSQNGANRSVHAFLNPETGDVLKAAGWKAPAKGIRYNLLDDESFACMLAKCDPFGGYLYVR